MRRINLAIFVSVVAWAVPAFAQDVASSKQLANEAAAGAPRLSADISYNVTTDLAEQADPRSLEHDFRGDFRYSLGKDYYVRALGNLYYSSVGRSILVNDTNNPIYWDLDLSVNKKFNLGKFIGASHQLRASARDFLPVSDESRYEGIKSIPGAGLTLNSSFFDSALIFSNALLYRYVINTYRFSPTTGDLNSRDSLSYSLHAIWNITNHWALMAGYGIKTSRRLDDTIDYAYNNFQAIDYSIGSFTFEVAYENGGFTREGDVSLWYVDNYRRIFTGSVTYSF